MHARRLFFAKFNVLFDQIEIYFDTANKQPQKVPPHPILATEAAAAQGWETARKRHFRLPLAAAWLS
jgi:hypothetical protein